MHLYNTLEINSLNNLKFRMFFLENRQMNKVAFSVLFASAYLLIFLFMLHTDFNSAVWALFLLSPFVIIYMVYMVIRYGEYSGRGLEEGEEWGYEDIDKTSLRES